MHHKIDSISNLRDKTAVVLGLGRNEQAAVRYLNKAGANVRVTDMRPRDHLVNLVEDLEKLDPAVKFEFGSHSSETFDQADFVVLSSELSIRMPLVEELRSRSLPIVSEIDLAIQNLDVPVIAIFGSHGKSSVAYMLKHIIEASGKKCFLASDLGEPLSYIHLINQKMDYVILEISTEQAENLQSLNPAVAVFTVFDPKPTSRFLNVDSYLNSVVQATQSFNEDTTVIYNYRNANLRKIIGSIPGQQRMFRRKSPESLTNMLPNEYRGGYFKTTREVIWTNGEQKELFDLRQSRLFGIYSKENMMAAIIAAKELGLPSDVIQNSIYNFTGAPHRLQFVKKRGGVRIINDSRSVSIDHLRKSLEAFPLHPVILIAGGKDSEQDFVKIAELVKKRVKLLVLIGEAKEQLNRALGDYSETYLMGTFEEAVLVSYQKSREGDVILFSPGCEAFDMFNDYNDRGNYFCRFLSEI